MHATRHVVRRTLRVWGQLLPGNRPVIYSTFQVDWLREIGSNGEIQCTVYFRLVVQKRLKMGIVLVCTSNHC